MFYLLDCLEGIKKLDDNSIDAIITSPPYNLNTVSYTHLTLPTNREV